MFRTYGTPSVEDNLFLQILRASGTNLFDQPKRLICACSRGAKYL